MTEKSGKTSLLDFFFDHVSEDDWLDGVDMYQAGKVSGVQSFNGLVVGKVSGISKSAEVRLKLHPQGHQIQWLECTCAKNRSKGYYCEHMAALMLHIDREALQLLGNLDPRMPLKPPAGAKKVRSLAEAPPGEQKASQAANEAILQHLDANIHSVNLISKGPGLRIRIEIKEGQLTHYDLPIDAAAKFLLKPKNLGKVTPEVKELKVFKEQVLCGTRIHLTADETIVAERVIALPSKSGEKVVHYTDSNSVGDDGCYVFFSYKTASKHLGAEYFYQPQRGYWPVQRLSVQQQWYESPLMQSFSDDEAAEQLANGFAGIRALGSVWLSEELKLAKIEDRQLVEIRIEGVRDGWFTLDPRYGDGKAGVSMVELMRAYKKKKRSFHKTKQGWIRIPELIKQFQWGLDESGEYIKVDTLGLMRLRAALGEFDQFAGSKAMLDTIRNRVEFIEADDLPPMKDTKLNLRNYQQHGLQWLWWLYQNGLHGLLADEMGLGKTHQAMALLSCIKSVAKKPRFLVICPTTVLDHWIDKIEAFCPNLNAIKHHGPKRNIHAVVSSSDFDVLVTSYGVVLRDIKQLGNEVWEAVVLDEAHFVKNNETATYQAVCRLNAKFRLCLTGTPMENRLNELKNIFDFLVPGYLGSDDYFKRSFLDPIHSQSENESETTLQKLIHPLKMRRVKVNVLEDLPEKVEDLRRCELSDEQVKLYKEIVDMKAKPLVDQLESNESPIPYLHVFATLNLLKQVCNHPALISGWAQYQDHSSGKFELLKELIEEALGSDHKIVIFSQYLDMIEIIKHHLNAQNIRSVTLTGQTRNRGEVIKSFQTDPNIKVFIGSLLAGGIGIDLTAASVVIHYDRWWNASKENQATDRVHRIGQVKNVQVLKLMTRGTLEEKIDQMIRSKQALFEKFLDKDEELFKSLTRQEMIELLK
jgi:superfamily II DNA or RNA helicase